MLTYKVTGRGILDKSGKELPIGAEVKYQKAPSKPWADRLALVDGADADEQEITNNTPEPEDVTEPAPDEPSDDDGEEIDLDELSDEQVRQLAKEYGIKSWHNKAIDKLKDELAAAE